MCPRGGGYFPPRMSNQPWIRPILIASNLVMPAVLFLTHFQILWLIALAVLVHGAFIYALTAPGCTWFGPLATRFIPEGNHLWLTIDDGPAGAGTERLADELTQRGVCATFFVKGESLMRPTRDRPAAHGCGPLARESH